MPLVTIIGEKLAEENKEFIYLGPNNDCRNCKLKTVCFNLKLGRHYKIIKIRDKRHSCNVHDGNAVIIEVQELPILTTVDKKFTEGSKIKIEREKCGNIGCLYYDLCNDIAVSKDKTYKIIKVHESVNCPEGYELKKAELTDQIN